MVGVFLVIEVAPKPADIFAFGMAVIEAPTGRKPPGAWCATLLLVRVS